MILRKGCSWSSFCYAAMFGHSHLWNPKRPAHRAASGMTPPHPLGDRQQQTNWLVVGPPLWKIWLRQLRDEEIPNINGKMRKMATKPPTSIIIACYTFIIQNVCVYIYSYLFHNSIQSSPKPTGIARCVHSQLMFSPCSLDLPPSGPNSSCSPPKGANPRGPSSSRGSFWVQPEAVSMLGWHTRTSMVTLLEA